MMLRTGESLLKREWGEIHVPCLTQMPIIFAVLGLSPCPLFTIIKNTHPIKAPISTYCVLVEGYFDLRYSTVLHILDCPKIKLQKTAA